jgi:uncharacterized OB-fold protein
MKPERMSKRGGKPAPVVACKNNTCNWAGRIEGQGRRARCPKCSQLLFPLKTDDPYYNRRDY